MRNNSIIGAATLFLLIVGVIAYFNLRGTNQTINDTNNTRQEPIGGSAGTNSVNKQVRTFEVEGKPFQFTPSEIKVKKGDTVRIVFKNIEGFHDWTLDEFNAKTKQIQAGQTDTVEFTADKAGTFQYYCSVDNHRQMGMVGNFIVED